MKDVLILIAIVLSAIQQTSNSLPFTAVSQPSPPVITSIVVQ
jgi:hypothetical protein